MKSNLWMKIMLNKINKLNEGRTNIRDEQRSRRPSIVTDELMQKYQRNCSWRPPIDKG